MAEKNRLRERYRALRAAMPSAARAAADEAIAAQVGGLPAFAGADAVFTYLSFGAEVDTRALIKRTWAAGKTVALPRVVPGTRQMRWYAVDSLDGLERSSFGVDEPAADPSREVVPGDMRRPLALVPGFSFDREGYRLGYGGGFYDGFLADFPGVSVGLCRAAQLSEEALPRDAHDVPVALIATDQGVLRR
ncbi:5-formyltetrahydrofolate cyclo-ligase [Adlercreutzia sp. R7]|uniref:5-formyltetrahydrofolate cyclo-ligase n=1 Tax=Adlercreutzia wanghongyangiae TaxID=3111451 RepID=A0ABU6IKA6_9ACTN|nr:5-formyltetrahydrofolate cyclo-ligase [Adlercreutzia sp. R7]